MADKEQIGMRIAELRRGRGMTQEELAEASGVDRTNISKIESGIYNVSIVILSKIATALGGTIDVISREEYIELSNIRILREAKSIFAYYGAENEDVKVFGDWAVNECGDIVNYKKDYPVYNYLLIQYSQNAEQALIYWHEHIREKSDFDIEHFDEAFKYALPLAEKQKSIQ